MANKKIIELTEGGAIQAGDYTIISRNMQDFKVDLNQLKDDTNTFTTGATLNATTAVFNRNDGVSYSLDLTTLSATPITSLAFSAITNTPTTLSGYGITDADNFYTTGATLSGYTAIYNRNDGNSYNLDLSSLSGTTDVWEKGIGDLSVQTVGTGCYATGDYAVALGADTTASGFKSLATGTDTIASGDYSHAEGNGNIASGSKSHAEGGSTTASGVGAHSEGDNTQAIGDLSHTEGVNTIANDFAEHVAGQFNVAGTGSKTEWTDTDNLFTLGNGADALNKSNAFQVLKNGNTFIAGSVSATTFYGNGSGLTGIYSIAQTDSLLNDKYDKTGGTINGNVLVTGITTINSLITTASTTTIIEATSGGTLQSSNKIFISAYITDGTAIANLNNVSNWDIDGVYTGTTITNTFAGQKHYNSEYFFEAVQNNLFIRLIRG